MKKLAEIDAMDGTLVVLGVRRAHEEVAGGNPRQVRRVGVVIVVIWRDSSDRPGRMHAGANRP